MAIDMLIEGVREHADELHTSFGRFAQDMFDQQVAAEAGSGEETSLVYEAITPENYYIPTPSGVELLYADDAEAYLKSLRTQYLERDLARLEELNARGYTGNERITLRDPDDFLAWNRGQRETVDTYIKYYKDLIAELKEIERRGIPDEHVQDLVNHYFQKIRATQFLARDTVLGSRWS